MSVPVIEADGTCSVCVYLTRTWHAFRMIQSCRILDSQLAENLTGQRYLRSSPFCKGLVTCEEDGKEAGLDLISSQPRYYPATARDK